ncbi:MAG: TadE family protein [Candidatus Dormiibacterota bacterium]
MIEFAIAIPVLALLLIGSIVLGKLAYQAVIVGEAVDEASKIAMVDRLSPSGGGSLQMSNDDLLKWIRAAAKEGDPTMDSESICPDGDWKFRHSPSDIFSAIGSGGNFFDNFNSQSNAVPGGNKNGDTTIDGIERWLNPGLQTMRVKFNFKSGINDAVLTVRLAQHATSYQMFTVPFNGPSGGSVSGSGC